LDTDCNSAEDGRFGCVIYEKFLINNRIIVF